VATPLPPRVDRIRWADLSPQSTAILRQVVVPIHVEGYKATDVAKRLGIPPVAVRLLVDYFANEIGELGEREPRDAREVRTCAPFLDAFSGP
jgi:DNA-directed RNA polymerase specialized sigma24 family protein